MKLEKEQIQYEQTYSKTGIRLPVALTDRIKENKHGIDNPVIDLNVRKLQKLIIDTVNNSLTLNRAVTNNGEVVVANDEIVYI